MQIESLLAARHFVAPQLADGYLYFVSNLSGRLSLYRLLARPGGSVPEPLLPPHLALQNPDLVGGHALHVLPKLGQVLVMLDRDGDENYQPMRVPMTGGFPVPAFGDQLADYRCHAARVDSERNLVYLLAESRQESASVTFRGHLETGALDELAKSEWGLEPDGVSADHTQLVLNEGYASGDRVLYWLKDGQLRVLHGTPLADRQPGQNVPLTGNAHIFFTPGERGLLLTTALFDDAYGLGYLCLEQFPAAPIEPVTVTGRRHTGAGELVTLDHLRDQITQQTNERILGLAPDLLARGEDASFTSFDGLRISARLYLPAAALGFAGPRPLVYYIHGGPQSQERPDFAWFSMPLIQFLTLNGLAVFVPNVRGSAGYGLKYMKQVDRDWGGADRLDHVHALTQVLARDPRLDVTRAGVTGRSYGGYMTLLLAARHPELWTAACDMFGPYNLASFINRLPPTWQPYFRLTVGDPATEAALLAERSPATYFDAVACPLLVIQGQNDPRVVEPESRDVVERLRAAGKQVDYLVFENEGHDVLKYENKVRCYNAITDFFKAHLNP